MTNRILVIEDERTIADTVCYALETENFQVEWRALGQEGIAYLKAQHVDLVVLDVGLPDLNGFEVCKKIRSFSEVPVLFLSARKEEIDRVVGLEIGADDYVVKPFSPRELVARIKVILKRVGQGDQGASGKWAHESFVVEEDKAQIVYRGATLELTRYEYRLLRELLTHPGRVFSREQLMNRVWDSPESAMDRTVDAHIKMLRAKFKEVDSEKDPIKTHRGMGYSIQKT